MQFEERIGQDVCDTKLSQGWPDRTQDYIFRTRSSYNQPADHDIVPRLIKSSRRNIAEFGPACWIKVVRLNDRWSGVIVHAANDSGVSARIEAGQNRRFEIVARRKPAIEDRLLIRCVYPVVVRCEQATG